MSATINQDEFVAHRQADWRELEQLLARRAELHRQPPTDISRLAGLYRSVCADLMRARVECGPELVRYLDGLAGRAHNRLYGARAYRAGALWQLLTREFPRTLRRRWRLFALASALFYLPLLLGLFGAMSSVEFARTIMPAAALANMEAMYEQGFESGRDVAMDSQMAGFYVLNNVGIAFRCFATGVLFGLGSIFFAIYNGLMIGVGLGWVIAAGHGLNIGTFICSHGPYELTAIVIATAAGLQMGWALVETGGRTRIGSLRSQGREIGQLIVGAAAMLVIAAMIEGFWSPSSLAPPIKWAASGVGVVIVTLWLTLGGRRRADAARDGGGRAWT